MRIGVLGGGQLGRMLALAGYPLGLQFRFLDPSPDAPAGAVAPLIVGSYEDDEALARFGDGLDAATYEFENVPARAASYLVDRVPVHPAPVALEVAQDRLREKSRFLELGIPTAPFAAVDSRDALADAIEAVGLPAVLKTRRFGYDGKGQAVVREPADADVAWTELGHRPLLLERLIPFERELSILAVRGRSGETRCYPLVENHHDAGILRLSIAPAPDVPAELQRHAEEHAGRVLDSLGYVGVLAIELFQHAGRLLANEMAPRVHNSGHYSIEGAETSQFENHVRAVAGLPLGSPAPVGPSAMVNLIGELPDPAAVLAVPGAHLHLYGKAPRPGRKLGHVTVCATNRDELAGRLERLRAALA